jgi:hypothetical protein
LFDRLGAAGLDEPMKSAGVGIGDRVAFEITQVGKG